MAFVPQLFMANMGLHGDFSKVAKFAAYITPPSDLESGGLLGGLIPLPDIVDTISLSFQCEVAELPGYNINTIEGRISGASYYVPATPVFNELNLTFICAGDLWEKKFFDDWMDLVLPKQKKDQFGYLANYPKNCYGSIRVVQFTEIGLPSYVAKFEQVFPYTMQPLATNWADDGIHRLTVGFRYTEWERESLLGNLVKSLLPQGLQQLPEQVVTATRLPPIPGER